MINREQMDTTEILVKFPMRFNLLCLTLISGHLTWKVCVFQSLCTKKDHFFKLKPSPGTPMKTVLKCWSNFI